MFQVKNQNTSTGSIKTRGEKNGWFERVSALVFLFIICFIIALLVYYPVNESSMQAVMLLLGALVAALGVATPRLFGSESREIEGLKIRVAELEHANDIANARIDTVKDIHDDIVRKLVEHFMDTHTGEGLKDG